MAAETAFVVEEMPDVEVAAPIVVMACVAEAEVVESVAACAEEELDTS